MVATKATVRTAQLMQKKKKKALSIVKRAFKLNGAQVKAAEERKSHVAKNGKNADEAQKERQQPNAAMPGQEQRSKRRADARTQNEPLTGTATACKRDVGRRLPLRDITGACYFDGAANLGRLQGSAGTQTRHN